MQLKSLFFWTVNISSYDNSVYFLFILCIFLKVYLSYFARFSKNLVAQLAPFGFFNVYV